MNKESQLVTIESESPWWHTTTSMMTSASPVHRGWSWPVCSRPSLWVNWRWLKWSCNCLPSNWLIPVDRSQNPSKSLFIGTLVKAIIEDYHKACNKLLWRLNKRHSFSCRPRRRGGGLANSTFEPKICKSSRCQHGQSGSLWWQLISSVWMALGRNYRAWWWRFLLIFS